MEEELETTLNFLRKTITSIAKLVPKVIVISNSKEEVEVGPQLVIEEQLQSIFALRLMEEEELRQPVSNERYLSKNFLKRDLFLALFFSAQGQEQKL